MTLKELMQLCYNAGTEINEGGGFAWWWKAYGEERHDAFAKELVDGMGGVEVARSLTGWPTTPPKRNVL